MSTLCLLYLFKLGFILLKDIKLLEPLLKKKICISAPINSDRMNAQFSSWEQDYLLASCSYVESSPKVPTDGLSQSWSHFL